MPAAIFTVVISSALLAHDVSSCARDVSPSFLLAGFSHSHSKNRETVKNVRGWQILTIEAAETLCMICLPPEEHIFRKKYLGNRACKKSHFVRV